VKILLTGATAILAKILPVLLGNGNEVICCVRDKARFDPERYNSLSLSVIEVDFLKTETLQMFLQTSMQPITLFTHVNFNW